MNRKIKSRAAILISLLLMATVVLLLSTLPHLLNKSTSYTAHIYKDGTLIQTIPLSGIHDTNHHTIGDPATDYNVIEVIQGSIRISEASCPDQICVNQGFISNSLVPITCLPNHLVIELKADDTDADAITY